MTRTRGTMIVLFATGLVSATHAGNWATFTDETATRLVGNNSVTVGDLDEKDYAWGDVDRDGDVDLIVVRKEPFTSSGGRKNTLFMNEGIADGQAVNGVLVERTVQYALDADAPGSSGFRDFTNDRDVVLVDLNGDEWLDVVTATTLSDGLPKFMSHPRVYVNKGEISGVWQGFRYEEARIPQLNTIGGDPVAPRFCSVAAGDVTGDGAPDLYFGDYDSSGAGGQQQPGGLDLNDRLLINDGNGYFTDSLQTRMTSEMLLSAFGTAVVIDDMNGDGVLDIIKDTGLNNPTRVSVSYNDPGNEGVFDRFDVVYPNLSPYFITVGDLNNDGLLDVVVTDDGTDRYLLNTGNDGQGRADFDNRTFPSSPSAGFGSNSVIGDLNNDGFPDVLIADVDVDIPGCDGRMHVYRNLGDLPDVSFQEQGQVVPNNMLTGTHDVALFDIDQNGWLDMVVGRCSGVQIWMNQPPTGIVYSYPAGLPAFVTPNQGTQFHVRLSVIGGGAVLDSTWLQYVSVNGGPFVASLLTPDVDDLYFITLPAVDCPGTIQFYVSAQLDQGGTYFDPPSAAFPEGVRFSAVAAVGTEISIRDEIEDDVSGWTIINDPGLTSGGWQQADPNGTVSGANLAAPEDDATQGADNVKAFVTENGLPGAADFENDVDGGPTTLVSPVIDLSGTDATITYARWFFSEQGVLDQFEVDVTANGVDWVAVSPHTTSGTGGTWETVSFVVSDYVTPSATVQVRFRTSDAPNDSVTEAGVDNFQVERFLCDEATCPGDFDDSGAVGFSDLTQLLSVWGTCAGCDEDLDQDGGVGFADLTALLAVWGSC